MYIYMYVCTLHNMNICHVHMYRCDLVYMVIGGHACTDILCRHVSLLCTCLLLSPIMEQSPFVVVYFVHQKRTRELRLLNRMEEMSKENDALKLENETLKREQDKLEEESDRLKQGNKDFEASQRVKVENLEDIIEVKCIHYRFHAVYVCSTK